MSRIYELKINNFRGIKSFFHRFDKDFVCLLGRGDSCKTTILEAISYVFYPYHTLSFFDNDFYNGDTNTPIEIEASVLDFPEKLLDDSKCGEYIRVIDKQGDIQDDLHQGTTKILTLKLEVKKDLEPQWYVINKRHDPCPIRAIDREEFNVFMVSDYLDRHFSWNKGSPLYSILKKSQALTKIDNNVIVEAIREARDKINNNDFPSLEKVTDSVRNKSSVFGVDISGIGTGVDFKEIYTKDGKICLHDNKIPLRSKGKGTRRLVSIAIQSITAQQGGIVLIDEVEQGLEPDRIKHLVRTLKKENKGQYLITTHSSEVITELEATDLIVVKNTSGKIEISAPGNQFQAVIRACPEAGYAKKVIVCEGSTEIGICRALDEYRKKNNLKCMSLKDCVYINGQGKSFTERAMKLNELGLKVCVFCDSDDNELQPTKEDLKRSGITIFDCESGRNIEHQVFQDLPWKGILELIDYVMKSKNIDEKRLGASLKSKYPNPKTFPEDFRNINTAEIRKTMGDASIVKDNEWFKRIDHGEYLGTVIFNHLDNMKDEQIRKQFEGLAKWIDE
jgi:energy-coupling factor transporter ATP-binding protein EcfA2